MTFFIQNHPSLTEIKLTVDVREGEGYFLLKKGVPITIIRPMARLWIVLDRIYISQHKK